MNSLFLIQITSRKSLVTEPVKKYKTSAICAFLMNTSDQQSRNCSPQLQEQYHETSTRCIEMKACNIQQLTLRVRAGSCHIKHFWTAALDIIRIPKNLHTVQCIHLLFLPNVSSKYFSYCLVLKCTLKAGFKMQNHDAYSILQYHQCSWDKNENLI